MGSDTAVAGPCTRSAVARVGRPAASRRAPGAPDCFPRVPSRVVEPVAPADGLGSVTGSFGPIDELLYQRELGKSVAFPVDFRHSLCAVLCAEFQGNAMKTSVCGLVGGASAVGLLWSCDPSVAPVWKIGYAIALVFALIALTARGS